MKYLNGLVLITLVYLSLTLQSITKSETEMKSKVMNEINNQKIYLETERKSENNSGLENSFLQVNLKKKSDKTNKSKKSKVKKQKLGKYTLKIIQNSELKVNSKKLKKYVTYSECNKKSGFLNFIQSRPKGKNKEITVYPIFVTINKFTLSLFHTYKSTTLFKIINLDSIQRVSLQYEKTFCFDIIINEIQIKTLKSGPLSLCAKNIKEMKDWIRAILQFKECKIKGSSQNSSIPHQGRTLVDFNKINTLIKQNKLSTSVNQLAYDGTDTVMKESPYKQIQRRIISKEVNQILHTIHMTKIAKNQLRRKMVGQFKRTRGKTQGAFHTEELLHNMLLRKTFAEKEQYATMLRRLNTKRTRKLLRRVKSKISKMSMKELKDYKNTLRTQIELEKQRAGHESSRLMKQILSQQKLTDYKICYHKRLYSIINLKIEFQDVSFAKNICHRYYGDYGSHMCTHKESFCQMCCNFHIGVGYPEKRFDCHKKCDANINPNIKSKKNKNKKKQFKNKKKDEKIKGKQKEYGKNKKKRNEKKRKSKN